MKTLRRLAFLALFAAAPAFAGPPAENVSPGKVPARNAPKSFTAEDLGGLVKGQFKEAEANGGVFAAKLPHTTKGGETMNWSVEFGLMSRGFRAPVVRIFFPCQKLPADPNADRLAKLMNQSGGDTGSPAYFMVGGKGADWLYLVSEVTTDGLTGAILKEEVGDLFAFAEQTSALWGGDLTTAPTQEKKAEKSAVAGEWSAHDASYNSGGAPPKPFLAGLNSLYFADGKVKAYVQTGGEKDGKNIDILSGTYTLKGDQLSVWFDGRKLSEEYTVTTKGDKLTLTPDKGNVGGISDKPITLNKW